MAHKIVFIGAGSMVFTRNVVKDLLTFPRFQNNTTLALVDINRERLDMARQCCEKILGENGCKAKIVTTTDRRKVMKGADAVIVTILSGGTDVWKYDISIPKKYGIDHCIGDTRGPCGIFRALRTIPVMLDICRDMEALCPDAIMLNYTNPMAMLCNAMQRVYPHLSITGLCHSVQGTAHMIARWLKVPEDEIVYRAAGINHMSWYLRLEHKGRDLYPRLRKYCLANRSKGTDTVRMEMFLALGHYPTESSQHHSEYNWWFRKRKDLIKKYCPTAAHAWLLKHYQERNRTWRNKFREWMDHPDWNDPEKRAKMLKRGREYAASIVNAWVGGEAFEFNGNVPNAGSVTNLPEGACVEIPVTATRNKLEKSRIGEIPPQCAALTSLTATIEKLTVDGALEGDARKVYQAIIHDPLTASLLSLEEAKKMTMEMFRKNRKFLKAFKKIEL